MLKKEMVIAKAQSVFKTFAVCAALFADLRLAASVQLATTVLPVQWEFSKKQRGGMDVKEWSLQFANSVIVNSGSGGLEQLHTKEDQNVADAVSMGHIISEKQK